MNIENEIITNVDFERLSSIISRYSATDTVTRLEEKLDNMEVLSPDSVPADLITMNSKFRCEFSERQPDRSVPIECFTLVYPNKANLEGGYMSVLSPLGIALLGVRAKRTIDWIGRDGCKRTVLVDSILYQPEASGDWHL